MGASLLVFANKSDVEGAMSPEAIRQVSVTLLLNCRWLNLYQGLAIGSNQVTRMEDLSLLCENRRQSITRV